MGFNRSCIKAVFSAFSLLILIGFGSIFMGIVSPTEAAGVGALGATILPIFKINAST